MRSGTRRAGAAAFVALLALAGPAAAADAAPWSLQKAVGLTLNGSVRVRYETLSGQVRPGFGTGEDILVLRSNVFAEYRTGAFRIGAELFDSRAYGADRGGVLSSNDVNALEPVQAYVAADLGPVFGRGSSASVQLGRMTLNLGSRRLVAADDYRNTTNGYTGVRFDGKGRGGETISLIYVAPQIRLPEDMPSLRANRVKLDLENGDLVLWGGVAAKPILAGKTTLLEVEYFGLDERDAPGRPTRNRTLHSVGARIVRAPHAGRLDYEAEAIRQTGTIRASLAPTAPIQAVSAGFAHLEVGYQFAAAWKPHLSLEYDRASGDHGAGRYNRFDTLFGMRGADYAPSGLFSAIGRANSRILGLRLDATPNARWEVMAHYAPMWLDSVTDAFSTTSVRDASGRAGRFAGHLLDGRLRYWIVPHSLRFEADGVLLAKGRFLEAAPNAPKTGDSKYLSVAMIAAF
jgi:hypothetical protein